MIKNLILLKKGEWWIFTLMFLAVSLININFNILRSVRNALVVAEQGGSAAFIPYFELFGTLPASILMTWGISHLIRYFSFRTIFSLTMAFFLSFFVAFVFWIYPHREGLQFLFQTKFGLLFNLARFKMAMAHWTDLLFYVMAELWKVVLLSVLFWGFINQHLSLEKAKRFYPPLMLGSSVGAILAGPITVFCTSQSIWSSTPLSPDRWQHSLFLLTFSLIIFGILTIYAVNTLSKKLETGPFVSEEEREKIPFKRRLLSLSSSIKYLSKSPYLMALLFIVIAEYVSYALGELIFLETLKAKFPSPPEYCQYLGTLTLWTGILTAFFALFLTPLLLQKYRWSFSTLLTPVLMVLMTFAFFAAIYIGKMGFYPGTTPISLIVFLGSLHFCIGRSIKYTIFDTTKELAFIPLNQEGQIKGKLVIDGIGSRLGRGTSSFLSILLFIFIGGPGESAIFAGILALCFALFSLPAARIIGRELEQTKAEVKS